MPPPPSSQKKKQQSISSFFTPKPAAVSKPSQPVATAPSPPSPPAVQIDQDNASQRRVSILTKRPIDTSSDEENREPNPKRVRPSPDGTTTLRNATGGQPKDTSSPSNGHSSRPISRGANASQRTSKYIFSDNPAPPADDEPVSAESLKQKELMHRRFVQKLGKPDSIAEIKRRNNHIIEGNAENGEDEEGPEDDEPAPKSTKAKKGGARANGKLTPLDLQVLEIKRKHSDTIIAVEVGYKFRFFGEDARTVAKELGLVCIPGKFRFDERRCISHMRSQTSH
jgi:DNA mismatch repair protein MSH3